MCHENQETRNQIQLEGSEKSSRRRCHLVCERFQEMKLAQIPQGGLSVRGVWIKPHPPEQFSSPTPRSYCLAAERRARLCDNMDCSTPGFPVLHHLPEFAQTHVHRSVMPSNHLNLCHPFSFCLQSFPASGSFPMSQFFTSGGQMIGASTSASVLPKNVQR